MNEFESFWDAIDQRLIDTKETTGLKYVERGSFAKKPAIRNYQATTWLRIGGASINIRASLIPTKIQVVVFVTGPTQNNVHKTHLETVKLGFKVAGSLHGFKPLEADANNSGCVLALKLNDQDEFDIIEAAPTAYTIAVEFTCNLNISN